MSKKVKSSLLTNSKAVAGAVCLTATALIGSPLLQAREVTAASFKDFDEKAKRGDRLTVVFFGCSLTWGANASDQSLTSFRARVADAMEKKYPKAHFKFYDAAIGGTNSFLGAYRIDRDVLARKPDLVFIDFTFNDDPYTTIPEFGASYEAIIRRIIEEAKCPVVQMFLCAQWNVEEKDLSVMKRRTAHYELSKAYGTATGDAILTIREAIEQGKTDVGKIWPYRDKCHPGDVGYQYYADAAMAGLNQAIKEERICHVPEKMINADTYMKVVRFRLPDIAELPDGWNKTHPSLTAAWHDALMSRWLDGVVEAVNFTAPDKSGKKKDIVTKPLKIKFKGAAVMIFGEKNPNSGKIRALIDGKPVEGLPWSKVKLKDGIVDLSSKVFGGNVFLAEPIAIGLDQDIEHELVIAPVFDAAKRQVVRIESICVAGKNPSVKLVK